MNLIKILFEIAWLTRIIANLLSYIHLWFVKEYRWDRVLIHLQTRQGKQLLLIPFRWPPLTPKTIALFGLSLVSVILSFLSLPGSWWLVFLVTDFLTFPVVSFWVTVLKIPTLLYHHLLIVLAINKLRSHKPMQVIGVTGSYGKTSTKENIATLLSQKYMLIKTDASKNSEVAVAELVLAKLRPEHKVFVVEMGAYKRGEIAKMCSMVMPQIGIVTAVNPQHQDLFGSIETTVEAKYELVAGLAGKKLAIFNADNPYTLAMSERAKHDGCTVWLYSKQKKNFPPWVDGQALISEVKVLPDKINFKLTFAKQTVVVTSKVVGEHQSENITAAILAAHGVGLSLSLAAEYAQNIVPTPKIMQRVAGVKGATFVNDTFNNNPDGARAAIEYLSITKGKKILVFQPMIELGTYAQSAHQEVGESAAKICDEIYLTNANFYSDFLSGVKKSNPKISVNLLSSKKTALEIKSNLQKGDTVLFKGKEAEFVLKELLK